MEKQIVALRKKSLKKIQKNSFYPLTDGENIRYNGVAICFWRNTQEAEEAPLLRG